MTKDDRSKELPYLWTSIKCTGCYSEVEADEDGYHCHRCHVTWRTHNPFNEEPGEFTEEDAVPCGFVHPGATEYTSEPKRLTDEEKAPRYWPEGARVQIPHHTKYPCSLPSDHEDSHYFPHGCEFTYEDAEGNEVADVVRT
jgi:hypothetical protein